MTEQKLSFLKRLASLPSWSVWIIRIILGLTFIFSGFVKGVDPWGTIYKFREYLDALSLPVWPDVVTVGVFLLCGLEFILGIFILLGLFRKGVPVITLLFMLFMLVLTLWLAIADPVSDCGCFGDAVILTNWQTFWKNVVLTVLTFLLLLTNRNSIPLVRSSLQWVTLVASSAYIIIISIIGYSIQPVIDFRQYKIGTELFAQSDSEEEDDNFVFVYKRGEEIIKVGLDEEQPDESDGWEFVDREERGESRGADRKEKALRIWNEDGSEDMTDSIGFREGRFLIIGMPELDNVSILNAWPLNSLQEKAAQQGITMLAVTAATPEEIEKWKDRFMPAYPVFTADDTSIKEAVRGNPGVIYAENDTIVWKSTIGSLSASGLFSDNNNIGIDSIRPLDTTLVAFCSAIYVGIMAFLILLGMIPGLFRFNRGDKATRQELKKHGTPVR